MSEFLLMISQLVPKPIIPAGTPISAPDAAPQKLRVYGAQRTKDMTLLACSRCGKVTPVATGYYIRATGNKQHTEGAPMQPCKACTKKKQAAYRERQRAVEK